MAKAKIAIGATKWIGGKLMRWSGTAWKASRRKVGGELAKRKSSALAKKGSSAITKAKSSAITKSPGGNLTKTQSKSITKSSGGKLTKTNNKIKPSTTANTSRDTVKSSGTRTGQPGKNRKLISASKPKPKPKPTMRSRLSSAWRNYQNQRWLDSKTTSGAVKRAMMQRKIGAGSFKGGLAEAAIFAGADYLLSPAAIWAGRQLGKGLVPVGRKIDDLLPGINSADERRRLYIADPDKAPGAIPNFDQLTPAQMAEFQAANKTTTPAGSRLPGESTADFHGRLRADLNRDFPTQPKVQTQEKKTNKKIAVKQQGPTAEELWIKKTANSPAAKAFSGPDRWKLHIANQKWRKKMGRTYTHID